MEKPSFGNKPFGKTLNVIAIIICIVLIPIIIANVTIIVRSFLFPDDVPGFLGYKPFIVLSDSMRPGISSGNLVLVKEVDPEQLKQGDIIAFREGRSVVTHRIVDVTEENGVKKYTTRGDNNNADDPIAVKAEMIEGVYLLDIPYLGTAALFLQTPAGMLVFIALPLILFIIYDILRRRRLDHKKQELTYELEKKLEQMQQQISLTEKKDND